MEANLSPSKSPDDTRYGPNNPLEIETWQASSNHLGLIERGRLLASLLWGQQAFTSISTDALDRIPTSVLSVVEHALLGRGFPAEESWLVEPTDLPRADTTKLDPDGKYPGKWQYEDRIASIIACSIDRTLTWRVVVMIEDQAGKLIGPALGTPDPLLQARSSITSDADFVGVHMTITPQPSPLLTEGMSAQTACRHTLLMAPPLELASLAGFSGLTGGKIFDIAEHVRKITFPADAPAVDCSGKIVQNLRAALLVLNTRLPALPSVVVTYNQQFGVLGDFTVEGPFHPFSAKLGRQLTSHTARSPLDVRINALDYPYYSDVLAARTNEQLSALAHVPVSLALQRQGLSQLTADDDVVISQTHVNECDFDERVALCTLTVSIKRGSKWVVPASDGPARLSSEPEGLIFSLDVASFKGEDPTSIVAYALRRLNRLSPVADVPRHVGFHCCALMLSPSEFAAQVNALSSDTPQSSLFYRSFMTRLEHIFRTTENESPKIAWQWAKIDFTSEPEELIQNVGVLISHSLGVSRFRIVRDKDTSVINLNAPDQPGDIHYIGSIPLGQMKS